MDHIGQLIEFNSTAFPRQQQDEELVNSDTMHGHALAKFIGDALEQRGFGEIRYVAEDWGWCCLLPNEGYELFYGVCSYEDAEFMIQFSPSRPVIRRLFRKIDVSERLGRLQRTVFEILENAPGRTQGPDWTS